jgi:hypothetical protein
VESVIVIPMPISLDVLACSVLINFSFVYEDGVIQSKPSLLGGSLHDGFPLLVIGDGFYINNLIHGFGDLLISLGKHIYQAPNGVYMFKTWFLNLFYVF